MVPSRAEDRYFAGSSTRTYRTRPPRRITSDKVLRTLKQRKPKGLAMVATARKLAKTVYWMLMLGKSFIPKVTILAHHVRGVRAIHRAEVAD